MRTTRTTVSGLDERSYSRPRVSNDKFLVAARNFASELEREKISQRTYAYGVPR